MGNILRNAVLFAALFATAAGQSTLPTDLLEDQGAVGLRDTLRRLANPYRVLHIVAHPDDEDSGTLTYLSRGLGADVTIASITRGESGANLITGDFFDALGVLRTLEYRKAARFYGARLRFTRFADFGYSKTLNETLNNWDREQVVADLVRIIREERPHVILARWRGDARDGHGHHQAAGLLAQEAYHAAADTERFPIRSAAPWQPLKLYSDNRRENDEWTVRVDAGVYDPMQARTYAQIGRQGLRAHRSQGAGAVIMDPGPALRHYRLTASEVDMADREQSFFERIDLEHDNEFKGHVEQATSLYRAEDPTACVPALLSALKRVRGLRSDSDSFDLRYRESLSEKAIGQALGISLNFLVRPDEEPTGPASRFRPTQTLTLATPGDDFEVTVDLRRGAQPVEQATVRVDAPRGWKVEPVSPNRYRISVPAAAQPTSAHWRRGSVWDAKYRYDDDSAWGGALPAPPLSVTATYRVDGVSLEISAPALISEIDSRGIQRRRPLAVGPAVSVEFAADAGVLPAGSTEYPLAIRLRNLTSEALAGTLQLQPFDDRFTVGSQTPFAFEKGGGELTLTLKAHVPADLPAGKYPIQAGSSYTGGKSGASFHPISSPGLETIYLSRPATHEAVVVDVDTAPNLRVGYVAGTGDAVPQAVRQLGARVVLLDSQALASGDLSAFDTILLGIRAYAVREDLIAHNARLLDYVKQGGVLIVQYNTPEFDNNYGPYPYKMTRRPEEVSEENSPIRILDPANPVFHTPNRITLEDFEGWVEQRGSKFLVEWDERYRPLIETHDTGQPPQRGGWLAARHGKGLYVYCAFAWYRQLPYAVPGAVRLFANLISLGAPDAAWR